ncbi:hypothetical protein AGMMS49959_05900 [Planctomycetales bacterium]|nr:hypothetical protein AGMMS49959_05900 [Planctomycetales bacterium]
MSAAPAPVAPPPPKIAQQFVLDKSQAPLTVSGEVVGERLHLHLVLPATEKCYLHWGLARRAGGAWTRPPKDCCPPASAVFDELAVRTPFTLAADEENSEIFLELPFPSPWQVLEFVLYFPAADTWRKNGRDDFALKLPSSTAGRENPAAALLRWYPPLETDERRSLTLDSGYDLSVLVRVADGGKEVIFAANIPAPLVLHWGATDRFHLRWKMPSEKSFPAATVKFDARAVRTPFAEREKLSVLRLFFADDDEAPEEIAYILYSPDEKLWHKNQNNDLTLALFARQLDAPLLSEKGQELAAQIIAAEVGKSSWTLMHRCQLARELILKTGGDLSLWQIIFVWLRYSAIRQLDWQRNYNTKPRDLAGAQKALTQTFAQLWREYPANRVWLTEMLRTVGRGGDGGQGQRIRDEILNIMHRHHLKEEHGHFIEEWHQKLHNNTTPDDIFICRAFIAFMESNGDQNVFYGTLEKAGVTRERLRNFERPIVTDPQYYGNCRDGLLHDLRNYEKVLLTVHGGAELELCGDRVAGRLSGGGQTLYGKLKAGGVTAGEVVALRREIADRAGRAGDAEEILDWVYFDAAVGDKFRNLYENLKADGDLIPWFAAALENSGLFAKSPELALCRSEWRRLEPAAPTREKMLEMLAVADRVSRVVQNETATIAAALQAPADYLGKNFGVADWARKIFVEEVVRGSDWFPLAKVIHLSVKKLRAALGLGGWQIISPAAVRGRVAAVENLRSVMEKIYAEPTLLLTEAAAGDEDAPEGVVGIITRVAPDLVAHLSVRSRNLGLLFAACFEDEEWDKLQKMSGEIIAAKATPAGAVEFAASTLTAADAEKTVAANAAKAALKFKAPTAAKKWVVGAAEFTREILGGKSNNLNLLRGKLPDWMHLPAAAALPFGVYEKVLGDRLNDNWRKEMKIALARVESEPAKELAALRALAQRLYPPPALKDELPAALAASGLPEIHWDLAWQAIKKVWASKWNERAYLSRRSVGMPHDALQMAVLIQQVVNAAYAFVIHTVNPITGNRDEIFAEVVLGLGETLVGNYPGHAFGFFVNKKDGRITEVSYPSKSAGLYSPSDKAVIFRSDSNGEDLAGFAGAGLYDSFLAEPPVEKNLDYTDEKLLTDAGFRAELCRRIAAIATAVEDLGGGAQDIEGAITADGRYFIVQNRPQVGV